MARHSVSLHSDCELLLDERHQFGAAAHVCLAAPEASVSLSVPACGASGRGYMYTACPSCCLTTCVLAEVEEAWTAIDLL